MAPILRSGFHVAGNGIRPNANVQAFRPERGNGVFLYVTCGAGWARAIRGAVCASEIPSDVIAVDIAAREGQPHVMSLGDRQAVFNPRDSACIQTHVDFAARRGRPLPNGPR